MDRGEITKMQKDIEVQAELKKFINKPENYNDFRYGSAANEYKGDMYRFATHAHEIFIDMLVAHAKYLVEKIDNDLNEKGVTK